MSDTYSLFPMFGDPRCSCLLPSPWSLETRGLRFQSSEPEPAASCPRSTVTLSGDTDSAFRLDTVQAKLVEGCLQFSDSSPALRGAGRQPSWWAGEEG